MKRKVSKKKNQPKTKRITKKHPTKSSTKSAKKPKIKSNKKQAKKAKPSNKRSKKSAEVIGVVTHYFPKVDAAVIKLKRTLSIGDLLEFKGKTTAFKQEVHSIQIDHKPVQQAAKGMEVGLGVIQRVRNHDLVLAVKKDLSAQSTS